MKTKRRKNRNSQPSNPTLPPTTKKEYPPAEITIEISLPNQKLADAVYTSLQPETRQPPGYRSQTSVGKNGKVVRLHIMAEDIVALRAASNSFLRFVSVALKTLNIVTPFYIAQDSESRITTGEIV